ARLERFVEEGLMTATPGAAGYAEYHLTGKGLDFKPVIIALTEWGDRWAAPDGAPIEYVHARCGGQVTVGLRCDSCRTTPTVDDVLARPTAAMARARQRRRAAASRARRSR
ncbi:MAG TPA: winged helix-turn-helix transcriptional regulator, partial [Gemmatimonadaceae bacterium]|nr:winged helix-turn-helix transcriptional regulator [Gemmatimonadaceae bacterium]